ncbi:intersectin-2-like [Stigmatopora nigra]
MNEERSDRWCVDAEERAKHDRHFDGLAPVSGHVSGERARGFFLRSGLPPPVLAQIWNLADAGGDGKMDRREFSAAMTLIKMTLQGRSLPASLPMGAPQAPHPDTGPSSAPFGAGSLPNLFTASMSTSILTPIPANAAANAAPPGKAYFPNYRPRLPVAAGLPPSGFSSPLTFSPPGGSAASVFGVDSLVDLGSSSSSSSSAASLASNSPKMAAAGGAGDWAVPQASRLKYRQQFNSLDKLMSGYLSGAQVRNALIASNLTQTQLATIWNLADVDGDGRLRADEFILAMHLVDTAQTGRPLPLSLPRDLVPPQMRGGGKCNQLINGVAHHGSSSWLDALETESVLKNKSSASFEDKLKENFARGSAELEKRRQALEEQRRKEREREDGERRQREELQARRRHRLEDERRKLEEERCRELQRKENERIEAAKRELEHQLSGSREAERREVALLRAKKKTLESELEAAGQRRERISERLREAQTQRRLRRAEAELLRRKEDTRAAEIDALRRQLEEWRGKLALLLPEQRKLTEKLHDMKMEKISPATLASLSSAVSDKRVSCRKLEEQLDVLQKESQEKLTQTEEYRKELEPVDMDDCLLRALLSLLACLSQLFLLLKELREKQVKQQSVLDDLRRVKGEKQRELKRRKEEAEAEEERQRKKRVREEERRRKEREDEEEERRRRKRIEEEEERQRRKRVEEEEERERRQKLREEEEQEEARRAKLEEMKAAEEERKREQKEKEEREVEKKEERASIYQALYSFTARNKDELTIDADCLIEVDEQTPGEPGWLRGSYRGERGWFPQSYAQRWREGSLQMSEPAFCPSPPPLHVVRLSDEERSGDGEPLDTSQDSGNSESLAPFSDEYARNGGAGWRRRRRSGRTEYVALYTYESPEAGDLTFQEGDAVLVTEREGQWWRGCIGDRIGLFPSNYVRPVRREESKKKKPEIVQAVATCAAGAGRLPLTPGQLVVVLAKDSSGWWLGELRARGRKRERGWFPSSHVKPLGSVSSASPSPVCQVIAMYDYTAANPDELSFSKGRLITVLDKSDPDWWRGEADGAAGLLPANYVQMTTECDPSQRWCADLVTLETMSPQERKRQGYIHELIRTEESYVDDLELVLEVFYKPMSESGRLTEAEMAVIFANWREIIACNAKFLKALRWRKKTGGGDDMPVPLIGDLLASELPRLRPYVRFCSCQLNGAALLQSKTDDQPDFKDFLKKIAGDHRCRGMPLSSFLLKPMQRITRYPLLIKNILENTPEPHADRPPLREALDRAEELCSGVNEGVREKDNSDRMEWIQSRVQCDGALEHLVFNSPTNCLGPRQLLHSGRLHKSKSSRELWAFLFNDFLLLTQSAKSWASSDKLFGAKSAVQFKTYKTPLFLNEVLVKMPPDPSSEEPLFLVSHVDRVYSLRTDTLNERAAWVQKIKAASELFIETEKKKREKAYQARSLKSSGIGRLLATVSEGRELRARKPDGKGNPYCELSMGPQCYTSRSASHRLNPKWNFNCQFFVQDLQRDVLSIAVFEKDQFSPDDFLGRTEVPVATIKKDGSASRRLLLHQVPTGEVWVKLDLQLYEPPPQ